jgi:hypothetical protein
VGRASSRDYHWCDHAARAWGISVTALLRADGAEYGNHHVGCLDSFRHGRALLDRISGPIIVLVLLRACTFERAWEHVTVTCQQLVGGRTRLVITWSDGVTRSHAFDSLEDAIQYQQQFESTLSDTGWVREAGITPRSRVQSPTAAG